MPKESSLSSLASLDRFLQQYAQLASVLHTEAKCAHWDLSEEKFAESLRRSAEKRFGGAEPDPSDVESYLKSLHLEDLALACACSEGKESAWEFFIVQFRRDLRSAASAMLRSSGRPDEARAAELADSLYSELYGVRSGEAAQRKSLFEYFHGRSKLSTWLRALLAQKQVDLFRASSRTVSMESETEGQPTRELAEPAKYFPADPSRRMYLSRVEKALSAALAALTPRERLLLACYYVDRNTLAQIGRMLREHESTVSRQLERIRLTLRENVMQSLRRGSPPCDGRPAEPALDLAQVALAFEYAVEDWPFDLSEALSEAGPVADARKK
jgi:RNA polymerase sigma-70 factor